MINMLHLTKITTDNWRLVADLAVHDSQKTFIEPNSISLLEAAFDQHLNWLPLAIYDGEKVIGFTMIGAFNQEDQSIWLDRFMIDQHFQGKGYGKKAFALILDFIKSNWEIKYILLSAHEENREIFSFYEAFGFKNTYQLDEVFHEMIMVLSLNIPF